MNAFDDGFGPLLYYVRIFRPIPGQGEQHWSRWDGAAWQTLPQDVNNEWFAIRRNLLPARGASGPALIIVAIGTKAPPPTAACSAGRSHSHLVHRDRRISFQPCLRNARHLRRRLPFLRMKRQVQFRSSHQFSDNNLEDLRPASYQLPPTISTIGNNDLRPAAIDGMNTAPRLEILKPASAAGPAGPVPVAAMMLTASSTARNPVLILEPHLLFQS